MRNLSKRIEALERIRLPSKMSNGEQFHIVMRTIFLDDVEEQLKAYEALISARNDGRIPQDSPVLQLFNDLKNDLE